MTNTLYSSDLSSLKFLNRGKVRDIYAVDDTHILIVATDRLLKPTDDLFGILSSS